MLNISLKSFILFSIPLLRDFLYRKLWSNEFAAPTTVIFGERGQEAVACSTREASDSAGMLEKGN